MNELLLLIFVSLLLPYILVPIAMRRKQSFSRKPRLRVLADGFLPKPVDKTFQNATSELSALGFTHKLDVVSLDYGPNIRVFMRMFIAKSPSITAIYTSLLPDGASSPIGNFVEFNTRFIDGFEISTHNSEHSQAPIEVQKKKTTILPSFKELKTIFTIHKHILNSYAPQKRVVEVPSDGNELHYLVESFVKDMQQQEALGCLTYDKERDRYRLTWAGAFIMGWYSLWPISYLRKLVLSIKAHLQLRSLARKNA